MELYLLRHGIAEERAAGLKDGERKLTPKGRKKIERLGSKLKEIGVSFDLIVSSPYVRARQTAEALAAKMKHGGEIEYTGNLLPGSEPAALVKELRKHPINGSSLLLVGHEPDLSQLASFLVTGTKDLPLELKKGGICMLQLETFDAEPCATLSWLVPPKVWGI